MSRVAKAAVFVGIVAYLLTALAYGENPLVAIPAAILLGALFWKGE